MSFDNVTKEYALEMEGKLKDLNRRLHEEDNSRSRNEFSRDYARVLYSSSFRRLQGKMQLLGIKHTEFFRNRLTHSLEVAQIARGIAEDLGIINPLVTETCALAHDLGLPPFGHAGEKVLHEIAVSEKLDGFEGNAQTLRILTTLEIKSHKYKGLNLTLRTLLGVIKYFDKYSDNKSKFLYNRDYEEIYKILVKYNLNKNDVKTIDMQIMDLADQIAYAAHDLEDSLRMGLFSIDELLYEFKISKEYRAAYEELKKIVKSSQKFASKATRLKSSEEFSALFRKELTSKIVNKLITDICYVPEEKGLYFKSLDKLANGLKKIVFELILRKPLIQAYEENGKRILKKLYEVYSDKEFNKELKFLPPEYRQCTSDIELKRNILDYMAGMMDQFAIEQYKKYFGESSLNILYDAVD